MNQPKKAGGTQLELCDAVALWCDELSDGVCGSAFALVRLFDRHHAYYVERVRALRVVPSSCRWHGECPFCGDQLEIDAISGWWTCAGCLRRGEPYGMEYLLFGRGMPEAWDACCRRADALMRPTPGERRVAEEIAC